MFLQITSERSGSALVQARSSKPSHIRQGLHLVGKYGIYCPAVDAGEPFKELFHCRAVFEVLE